MFIKKTTILIRYSYTYLQIKYINDDIISVVSLTGLDMKKLCDNFSKTNKLVKYYRIQYDKKKFHEIFALVRINNFEFIIKL